MSIRDSIDRITQNVKNTYAVLLGLGADIPDEQNSDNLAATAGTTKAVLYSEQTLAEEQKAQARNNIGSGTSNFSGNYDDLTNKPLIVNPNLLDNWYFGNPVNQRGQTEYGKSQYTIDRWMNGGYTVSVFVRDGYIETDGTGVWLQQKLEQSLVTALEGKQVTASVLLKDGRLFSGRIDASVGTGNQTIFVIDNYIHFQISLTDGLVRIVTFASGSYNLKVVAIKLELGSAQTLAHNEGTEEVPKWVLNEIPDYGEQLVRCQRYFLRLGQGLINGKYGQIGIGLADKNGDISVWFYLPVPMRETPTPTLTGTINAINYTNSAKHPLKLRTSQAVNAYTSPEQGVVVLTFTPTSTTLSPGSVYGVQSDDPGGGYVDLSADL